MVNYLHMLIFVAKPTPCCSKNSPISALNSFYCRQGIDYKD